MLVYLSAYAWTRQKVTSENFTMSIIGEMWDSGGALEIVAGFDGEGLHVPDMFHEVGFEPVLEHINAGIKGPSPAVHPTGGRLFQFLFLAKLMVNNNDLLPKAWPAYCKYPLLNNISDAYRLDQKTRKNERKDIMDEFGTWIACFIHLAYVPTLVRSVTTLKTTYSLSLKAILNHEIPSEWVRAEDVMFIYARGFKICFSLMQRRQLFGGCSYS